MTPEEQKALDWTNESAENQAIATIIYNQGYQHGRVYLKQLVNDVMDGKMIYRDDYDEELHYDDEPSVEPHIPMDENYSKE